MQNLIKRQDAALPSNLDFDPSREAGPGAAPGKVRLHSRASLCLAQCPAPRRDHSLIQSNMVWVVTIFFGEGTIFEVIFLSSFAHWIYRLLLFLP